MDADLEAALAALRTQLRSTFRLDAEIGGRRLGDLVETLVRDASAREGPAWGGAGDPGELRRTTSGTLAFLYRPHLFPGMDPALRLGHLAQYHLLPRTLPNGSPVEIAASLESYCHLSGDLFGWQAETDGRITLWLLDVSGHGVRAGFAAVVMALLLDETGPGLPLDSLAARLERRFLELRNPADPASLYTTGVLLRLGAGCTVEHLGAGHYPPLLLRRQDGAVEQIVATGPPLALLAPTATAVEELGFDPGDLLLLASDGLTDLGSDAGRPFGLDRVTELIRRCEPEPSVVVGALHRAAVAHHDPSRLEDDLTILAVRRRGSE